MEEFEDELKRIIRKQIDSKIMIMTALVKSVNTEKYTITIENNLLKKSVVPLRALSIANDKGIIPIPKIGSKVVLYYQEHSSIIYIRILSYSQLDKVLINTESVNIEIDNNNVSIIADKIYINTENENEPITLGTQTQNQLNTIYDYITDLYNKLLSHLHGTSTGPTTPILPPEITQIPVKQAEVSTDKSTTNQILSDNNFTE